MNNIPNYKLVRDADGRFRKWDDGKFLTSPSSSSSGQKCCCNGFRELQICGEGTGKFVPSRFFSTTSGKIAKEWDETQHGCEVVSGTRVPKIPDDGTRSELTTDDFISIDANDHQCYCCPNCNGPATRPTQYKITIADYSTFPLPYGDAPLASSSSPPPPATTCNYCYQFNNSDGGFYAKPFDDSTSINGEYTLSLGGADISLHGGYDCYWYWEGYELPTHPHFRFKQFDTVLGGYTGETVNCETDEGYTAVKPLRFGVYLFGGKRADSSTSTGSSSSSSGSPTFSGDATWRLQFWCYYPYISYGGPEAAPGTGTFTRYDEFLGDPTFQWYGNIEQQIVLADISFTVPAGCCVFDSTDFNLCPKLMGYEIQGGGTITIEQIDAEPALINTCSPNQNNDDCDEIIPCSSSSATPHPSSSSSGDGGGGGGGGSSSSSSSSSVATSSSSDVSSSSSAYWDSFKIRRCSDHTVLDDTAVLAFDPLTGASYGLQTKTIYVDNECFEVTNLHTTGGFHYTGIIYGTCTQCNADNSYIEVKNCDDELNPTNLWISVKDWMSAPIYADKIFKFVDQCYYVDLTSPPTMAFPPFLIDITHITVFDYCVICQGGCWYVPFTSTFDCSNDLDPQWSDPEKGDPVFLLPAEIAAYLGSNTLESWFDDGTGELPNCNAVFWHLLNCDNPYEATPDDFTPDAPDLPCACSSSSSSAPSSSSGESSSSSSSSGGEDSSSSSGADSSSSSSGIWVQLTECILSGVTGTRSIWWIPLEAYQAAPIGSTGVSFTFPGSDGGCYYCDGASTTTTMPANVTSGPFTTYGSCDDCPCTCVIYDPSTGAAKAWFSPNSTVKISMEIKHYYYQYDGDTASPATDGYLTGMDGTRSNEQIATWTGCATWSAQGAWIPEWTDYTGTYHDATYYGYYPYVGQLFVSWNWENNGGGGDPFYGQDKGTGWRPRFDFLGSTINDGYIYGDVIPGDLAPCGPINYEDTTEGEVGQYGDYDYDPDTGFPIDGSYHIISSYSIVEYKHYTIELQNNDPCDCDVSDDDLP